MIAVIDISTRTTVSAVLLSGETLGMWVIPSTPEGDCDWDLINRLSAVIEAGQALRVDSEGRVQPLLWTATLQADLERLGF